MSFLHSRNNSTNRNIQLFDLPEDNIKRILSFCNMVDLSRCSLVSKRFRELIEDMEDEQETSIRCTKSARIFICDRRRAILEGMSTFVPKRLPRKTDKVQRTRRSKYPINGTRGPRLDSTTTQSSATTGTDNTNAPSSSNVLPFIDDQYADNSKSNWAFTFDFEPWLSTHQVREVYFKNFCSFIDREKSGIEMNYKGSNTISPLIMDNNRSFDKIPHQHTINESMIVNLKHKDIDILKRISAGRVERLAKNLENVQNAHFVFKDFCCYSTRPPALIFWFISLLRRNISSITLDRVQSPVPVELHEVMSLSNIKKLHIVQHESKPAMLVRSQFLLNWLRLPNQIRKKVSIHLTGCREITPKGLAAFACAWKSKAEPAVFEQISIDGNSYKFVAFINELENLQEESEREPPGSPSPHSLCDENVHDVVLEKCVELKHLKNASHFLRFRYCKPSRRMVLTCEYDDRIVKTVSPTTLSFSRLSLSRPSSKQILTDLKTVQSSADIRGISGGVSINGCHNSDNTEEPSFVNRMLRLLA